MIKSSERLELIRKALLIRRVEEKLLQLYETGKLSGTVHTCIGQEWASVAVIKNVLPGDFVFSNHRCHGHFLALTDDIGGLIREIMGRPDGVCSGVGGSQHLYVDGFLSNGIQGGLTPISVGWAFAQKLRESKSVAFTFIGDGTFGEGVLYEALNLASNWAVSNLFIVENNGIAQSTRTKDVLSGSIEDKIAGFNIDYRRANTWEWEELIGICSEAVDYVRTHGRPLVLEIETYRLKAHSKGDDTRDTKEIREHERLDPLNKLLVTERRKLTNILVDIDKRIDLICRDQQSIDITTPSGAPSIIGPLSWEQRYYKDGRVNALIYEALDGALNSNPRIVLLGEDISHPYGGAFKVTKDLSSIYPDQVYGGPISESGLVGAGIGLSIAGYIPIIEIMFGDFLGLAFDQIINHACKLGFTSNGQLSIKVIIRTPMGGYRGYGSTHSQSLEKHFVGIPDLKILALNDRVSPLSIYETLVKEISSPVLVIENKTLYSRFLRTSPLQGFEILFSNEKYPSIKITPRIDSPDVVIFCYGGLLTLVEEAVEEVLEQEEILCEIFCPTQIQPLIVSHMIESVSKVKNLITVEEGTQAGSIGSELAAKLIEHGASIDHLVRVSSSGSIPSSKSLEKLTLPDKENIIDAIYSLTIGTSSGQVS